MKKEMEEELKKQNKPSDQYIINAAKYLDDADVPMDKRMIK
ncbi:hypothetical protein LCGC14_0431380 [marine sediment metagenome]|uniref:Uncharacterized protein n=1 Tax=marine sediment metagenome TaxID=412755 RepID=A0A0F9VXL3_9ZZZZ